MSYPVVKADLEARWGAGEIARWSGGTNNVANDSNVDTAIGTAWSKARSAALNVFTAASWDALTSVTLPLEAKSHIISDAIDILSAGKNRPDTIDKQAAAAQDWRSWLTSDKVRCFDGLLTKLSGGAGFKGARESRVFGRSSDSSNPTNFDLHDPSFK